MDIIMQMLKSIKSHAELGVCTTHTHTAQSHEYEKIKLKQ